MSLNLSQELETALEKFLAKPTTENKSALIDLIDSYPDLFIENLSAISPPEDSQEKTTESRTRLARSRYTNMPMHAGVFVFDSEIYNLSELPEGERLIMHFRQKQEFKGQKP